MDNAAKHQDEFPDPFESAFSHLQVRIGTACSSQSDWTSGVAAGIRAGFLFAAAEPAEVRLLTTEALAAGKSGFARYERVIDYLRDLLAPGRIENPEAERLPSETERALAGGIAMLVAQRLDMGRQAELPDLAGEATQFVLTPYLGLTEAQRIAAEISN